jgi:hypothetical protein
MTPTVSRERSAIWQTRFAPATSAETTRSTRSAICAPPSPEVHPHARASREARRDRELDDAAAAEGERRIQELQELLDLRQEARAAAARRRKVEEERLRLIAALDALDRGEDLPPTHQGKPARAAPSHYTDARLPQVASRPIMSTRPIQYEPITPEARIETPYTQPIRQIVPPRMAPITPIAHAPIEPIRPISTAEWQPPAPTRLTTGKIELGKWSPGTDMRSFVGSFLEECSLKQISGSFMQRMLEQRLPEKVRYAVFLDPVTGQKLDANDPDLPRKIL